MANLRGFRGSEWVLWSEGLRESEWVVWVGVGQVVQR